MVVHRFETHPFFFLLRFNFPCLSTVFFFFFLLDRFDARHGRVCRTMAAVWQGGSSIFHTDDWTARLRYPHNPNQPPPSPLEIDRPPIHPPPKRD